MNFGQFTDKIIASAANAAVAARSFKGFDAMAEDDDYIHSESLNVRNYSQPRAEPPTTLRLTGPTIQQDELSYSHRNAASRSVKSDTRPITMPDAAPHPSAPRDSSKQLELSSTNSRKCTKPAAPREDTHNQKQPLLPVVRRALSGHSESQKNLSYDDDDDDDQNGGDGGSFAHISHDSDDEEEADDDPILSMIRRNESTKRPDRKKEKKNTKRFLEDLENRMSVPIEPPSEESDPFLQNTTCAGPGSGSSDQASSNPLGWMSTLKLGLSSNSTTSGAPEVVAAWSKSRIQRKQQKQKEKNEESFEIVASSGILGADEMNELAQLKQQTTQTHSVLTLVWQLPQEHPRECFILFTLLLGAFSYFYSRGETVQDDVHRS